MRAELPTDKTAGTKGILAVIEGLFEQARGSGIAIEAVGVGAAGFVDARAGAITFSPNLVYDDPHIAAAVAGRFGVPATVDNDANAAAWAERAYGSAVGVDDLVVLTLGTGIGSGFIANGRLVRGHTGSAAEFGHTVVDPDGPPCGCGLRGCIEQLASGQAIARMAREALAAGAASSIPAFAGAEEEVGAIHVTKAAREYDELARDILGRAGVALGIGLSNLANLFDPEVIVLGGGVVGAGEPYLGPARDQLAGMTTAQRRRPMRLDVSNLRGDAGIVGAAALAFDAIGRSERETPS